MFFIVIDRESWMGNFMVLLDVYKILNLMIINILIYWRYSRIKRFFFYSRNEYNVNIFFLLG